MKTAFIMIGCPGSGKSTWVEEHNLFSISRDKIRPQLGYCKPGEKFVGTKEQEMKVTEESETKSRINQEWNRFCNR